jgi:hypothetical protein
MRLEAALRWRKWSDPLAVEAADAIAALRRDAERMDWCLPLLTGGENAETNARTMALVMALLRNLDGREAIDAAIAASQKDTQ